MASDAPGATLVDAIARIGRTSLRITAALGYGALLLWESLVWLIAGPRRGQPVRTSSIFSELVEVGLRAIPIVTLLTATIGVMLAIQSIYQLEKYGAERQVVLGVAFGMTREFAPLITGILVAGRSGSALAARLGTMTIRQEVDALRTMGINPVRFLVAPSLLALVLMLPALVIWADLVSLAAAGLFISSELGMTLTTYWAEVGSVLEPNDVLHGLAKSAIFAVLITLVGAVDGSGVEGGAEGVGRVTTRAVVHGITAIVLVDMLFAFSTTRV